MKKNISIILFFAVLASMALATAGCTKTQNKQKTVDVTFLAGKGNAKVQLLENGVITFVAGDRIHVYGAINGYLGYLDFQGSVSPLEPATFYGALKQWREGETLRFYYMGDHTPTEGQTLYISLADQTYEGEQSPQNDLDNIAQHFLVSSYEEENVPADKTLFVTNTDENPRALTCQMSVAAFNTSQFDDGSNVKFFPSDDNPMKNCIIISNKGELSYGQAGQNHNNNGHIIIGSGQALRYVSMLPKDDISGIIPLKLTFTSNVKMGALSMIYPIEISTLITDYKNTVIEASDAMTAYVDLAPAVKSNGSPALFTVNSSGKQVSFAKGNLVYDQGRFKMHSAQYGVLEKENLSAQTSLTDVRGIKDDFQYGCSGWDCGNLWYMPYSVNPTYTQNIGPTSNLTGAYSKADWGVYQFGMNATPTNWRTLTQDEWNYVFKTRPNAASKYGHGKVGDVRGMFLLPDEWMLPSGLSFTPGNSRWGNVFTMTEWEQMEAAGAVFLPAYTYMMSYTLTYQGIYWTSTFSPGNNNIYAKGMYFSENTVNYSQTICLNPYWQIKNISRGADGQGRVLVRLVCDAD